MDKSNPHYPQWQTILEVVAFSEPMFYWLPDGEDLAVEASMKQLQDFPEPLDEATVRQYVQQFFNNYHSHQHGEANDLD